MVYPRRTRRTTYLNRVQIRKLWEEHHGTLSPQLRRKFVANDNMEFPEKIEAQFVQQAISYKKWLTSTGQARFNRERWVKAVQDLDELPFDLFNVMQQIEIVHDIRVNNRV